MTGPVVNELSAACDLFWNSEWVVPAGAVVKEQESEEQLRAAMKRFEQQGTATGYPYPIYENVADLRARLVQIRDRFIWAPGRVFVEDPARVDTADAPQVIATALRQRVSEVKRELLIESPYFVLGAKGIEAARQLTARGVKVRVLTNSAASSDVMPAQAGYANTRMQLLQAGVELYELRPDSNMKKMWSLLAGKSLAALHAKCFVFDRQSVWIGSFNLDPRSTALNTEIGVMIDSPAITGQVAEIMDEGVSHGSAFHVTLDTNKDLVWTAENDGEKVEYYIDPGTSLWHRFKIGVLRLLPIEDQL